LYHLLIVDDEHHIVNWLAQLFQDQTDLELEIYKAYSGNDALKIFGNQKMDVLLIDIQMPGINGLEVASRVSIQWPACRIIFLTGYSNFDYIYQADKYKNATYLLKTESDEGIITAVRTSIESLQKERQSMELLSQVKQKENLLHLTMQRNFLKDIILGKPLSNLSEHLPLYAPEWNFDLQKPVYLMYMRMKWHPKFQFSTEYNLKLLKLVQIMENLLYDRFQFSLLDLEDSTIVWFFQPNPELEAANSQLIPVYLKNMMDEFISLCNTRILSNVILVFRSLPTPWNMVCQTYQILSMYYEEKIPQRLQSNALAITLDDDTWQSLLLKEKDHSTSTLRSYRQTSDLSLYLYQGDQKGFTEAIDQISENLLNIKSMHYLPALEMYMNVSLLLMKYITQNELEAKLSLKIGFYQLYYINNFTSWAQAFDYLKDISYHIFSIMAHDELSRNQKIVKFIKAYINEHLSENLTLTSIADVVNYNASYISRLFKHVAGMGLWEYINSVRVEKGKWLLRNTNDTIQTIATKTGFDTTQYFSMVFKKSTGVTPRDYRNQ
jgi:YesN/AraC family two-component response regulator